MVQDSTKPRIQVKNPAELIEKPEECMASGGGGGGGGVGGGSGGGVGGDIENRSMMDEKESEIPSPDVNKTTGKFNFRRGHEPVHLLYSIVL